MTLENTIKVKLIQTLTFEGKYYTTGEVLDLPVSKLNKLIHLGIVEKYIERTAKVSPAVDVNSNPNEV